METDDPVVTEQLSLFLGRGWLLTFQERPGDCFDPVRDRIRQARGRIRAAGADYLAYALLDAVVDGYFPAIEHHGERLEALEDEVMGRPAPALARAIQDVRHDLLTLRRAAWPLRDVLGQLQRDGAGELVADETRVYLRDSQDHATQVLDFIETYRELGSGLMEMYLSAVGNRMNEIMKVLTILATIFMPLSFLAAVWGMNFAPEASPFNMPELHWRYGYPAALGVMAALGLGLAIVFRRAGWFARSMR